MAEARTTRVLPVQLALSPAQDLPMEGELGGTLPHNSGVQIFHRISVAKSIDRMVTLMENDNGGRCGYGGGDNSAMISMLSMQMQQQGQNQFMQQQLFQQQVQQQMSLMNKRLAHMEKYLCHLMKHSKKCKGKKGQDDDSTSDIGSSGKSSLSSEAHGNIGGKDGGENGNGGVGGGGTTVSG